MNEYLEELFYTSMAEGMEKTASRMPPKKTGHTLDPKKWGKPKEVSILREDIQRAGPKLSARIQKLLGLAKGWVGRKRPDLAKREMTEDAVARMHGQIRGEAQRKAVGEHLKKHRGKYVGGAGVAGGLTISKLLDDLRDSKG